jgi:chromosome segregation ATPase
MRLENDQLNNEAASYKAELEMMRHEIMDEKLKYDALKQLVDNKKKRIVQLDDYRTEQQTKIKTLESTKEQREAEIATLQKAGNALSQNYETLQQQVIEKKVKLVKLDDCRDTRKSEISELEAMKQKYQANIKTLQKAKNKLDNQDLPKRLNEKFGSYLHTFKAMERFAELTIEESKVVIGVCDDHPGLSQLGFKLKRARDGIQDILSQHARHLTGLNNAAGSTPKFLNETSSGGQSLPERERQLKTGRN